MTDRPFADCVFVNWDTRNYNFQAEQGLLNGYASK